MAVAIALLAPGLCAQDPADAEAEAVAEAIANARPPTVPAVAGTVVDALTGRPLAGIAVVQRVEAGFDNKATYQTVVTAANGRFAFAAHPEPAARGFLSGISEISLAVNRVLDAKIQYAPSDVTLLARHGTLSNAGADAHAPMNLQNLGWLSNRAYFPVSVQFLSDCNSGWKAACVSLPLGGRLRIALIPVLNDPQGCTRISDASDRERCRQLNTYRAAFLHLESVVQVRQDKQICEAVDQGPFSRECLEHLHNDVRLRAPPLGGVPPPTGMDPLDRAMILTSSGGPTIGGLISAQPGLNYADLFEESGIYWVRYSSATARWGLDPIMVTIDVFASEPGRKEIIARLGADGGFPPGAEKEELVDGNRVTSFERRTILSVAWRSGTRIVGLRFDRSGGLPPEDRAAAAQGWPELIRAYLRKYPSTNPAGN